MARFHLPARRVGIVCAAVLIAVLAIVAGGEALGWPFLAAPMQRWLGSALQRPIAFGDDAAQPRLRTRLVGAIELSTPSLLIGAPAWSRAPHLLLARDARASLTYADLWRAWRGQGVHIAGLRAASLDAHLEREADGRASWQFGRAPAGDDGAAAAAPAALPSVGLLQVGSGRVSYRDVPLATQLDATFALDDGATAAPMFRLQGQGRYHAMPASVTLQTRGLLPLTAQGGTATALPLRVEARVGRASLSFIGTATDALELGALRGRFDVQGPSLAALGDPLRVTLPSTGPFHAQGLVAKDAGVWSVVPEQVTVGSSRLAGAFTYDSRAHPSMLAGRLVGARLLLADLGPMVGTRVPHSGAPNAPGGRVLPDRTFDLPSLRAMNANVLVDIASLDLGSTILAPLEPLRTHLVLDAGVLTLRDLDARAAQGRLGGTVQFDGRAAQARWRAELHWADIQLERWIRAARGSNTSPYVTGRLSGEAEMTGTGRSTAAILASLRGRSRLRLSGGTISHLVVEAAGLDLAQALGLMVKGDDALPIQCTLADVAIEQGVLRPRALALDTRDSTLWIDGTVSLATERMALRLVAAPKDFSPLALRAPLHVGGSFADPTIAFDKGKLGAKLGAAALLGLVNPLAALIPLVDPGNADATRRDHEDCRAFAQRIGASALAAK